MSDRILTVLGTAAQMPTRERNHNGLFLKWDEYGLLFDPGEGTQRQMTLAGIPTSKISHVLISHFHGDHCLGLAGVVQRISIDDVNHEIHVYYPASGQTFLENLLTAAIYLNNAKLKLYPINGDGVIYGDDKLEITARGLNHRIETYGFRVQERSQRTLIPGKLKELDIKGKQVGQLIKEKIIEIEGRRITLEQVSKEKPTQSVAVIMDTGMCRNGYLLSKNVDLLVCESTYLESELELAKQYGHLTARQAATIAAKSGVNSLVLTHFSQRYPSGEHFEKEAQEVFPATVAARDLDQIPLPVIRRRLSGRR